MNTFQSSRHFGYTPQAIFAAIQDPAEVDGTRLHGLQMFEDPTFAQAMKHILEPANAQNLDMLEAELGRA